MTGDKTPVLGMNGFVWKKTVALLGLNFKFIVPPITAQYIFSNLETLFNFFPQALILNPSHPYLDPNTKISSSKPCSNNQQSNFNLSL